jgi:hypothetical protein
MEAVKRFTRSVTALLLILIGLVLGYLIANIPHALGIWSFLDGLYQVDKVEFWVMLAVSRVAATIAFFLGLLWIVDWGHKNGYFWFRTSSDSQHHDPPGEDKSGKILFIILVIAIAIFVGEVGIRAFTLTPPPYPLT